MFYRLMHVQRSLLVDFLRSLFGERTVPIRYPLVRKRLLSRLGQMGLPLEPLERQLGAWFGAIYARPPRRIFLSEGALLLLCILHNLLFLCHPAAREMGRLYRVCRRRTEEMIATLPPARDRDTATVYHAVLDRFEPFLATTGEHFEVQLKLERTVHKSPLTVLLWMEHLSKVSFDGLKVLMRDRELAHFVMLSIVDKERLLAERHLPRVREAIRTLERLDGGGLNPEPSLTRELEALRGRFTGQRARRL